jgi:hypothetical protein
VKLSEIKWDPSIYPRSKWSTATVERYADAMLAGDTFPALIIEAGTNRLLDGKHRMLAYEKAGVQDVPVEMVSVPGGVSAKHFAATLSSRHGDRMSNADLKELAIEEFDPADRDPDWAMPDAQEWGRDFGISKSTVYEWVSHFINRARADRQTKAWRLSRLGWTQQEIADRLGVSQQSASDDTRNSEIGKIGTALGESWNTTGVAEWANRMNVPLTDAMAAAMGGMDDVGRLKKLDIKIQPYDVWNFQGCHDLMGDKHPGRIPGEIVCHALWYWTKPGDLVVDPMSGSGTTLDACLLMGRKCRGYDIDLHHNRVDVEQHDLTTGWPESVSKASMVFWDPPYFDKMDDGYVDGSVSGLSPDQYLRWFSDRFLELGGVVKEGTTLAFLMSDWDPENAKRHADHPGIYLWDYVRLLQDAGWTVRRQIQVPLPTQQVHPDIVNKFRESRRMARLGRWLLEAVR